MICILDQMQVFDQKVSLARPRAQQKLDLMRSGRIDLTALGGRFGPLSSLAGVLKGANFVDVLGS